uniref:Putative secreted protein n=1 Tax=Anopheles triannulatus TaxID=58253 RepID=A0A2M4B5G4_9DIPT
MSIATLVMLARMLYTWMRLLMTSAGKMTVQSATPPTAPATIVFSGPISSFDWPGFANSSRVPSYPPKKKK